MSIPIRPLEKIREALVSIPEAEAVVQDFVQGDVLMSEGSNPQTISLIIRGEIELLKHDEDGDEYPLGTLRPGQFLGLLSLSSGEASFFTARAAAEGTMLTMPNERFVDLLHNRIDFHQFVTPLLLGNLVDRYRRVVKLHLEVAELTRDLDIEKQQLQKTISELQETRNRLIQQEKMATLGQLTAGIAHEINNPIASMSRAADSIYPQMSKFFESGIERCLAPIFQQAFELGLNRDALQTQTQRDRAEGLREIFPNLPRPLMRTLAQVDPKALADLKERMLRVPESVRYSVLTQWADTFEAGVLVRNVRVAAKRISGIVGSLKSYSRQDKAYEDDVDLREGLNDTLVLFGYVLKKFDLIVDLPEIPLVRCRPSEINQVWTNLILNACEAMGDTGTLWVCCGARPPDQVWVRIQDSGPGVPRELREKIFESSFSTKKLTDARGSGMGLGLAIARGIVEKHGGRIVLSDAPEGGAIFTLFLPTGAVES